MSQCRRLTVLTKVRGQFSAARWDLDRIHETGEWSLQTFDSSESQQLRFRKALDAFTSGTVVVWEHFDRIANSTSNFKIEFDDHLDYAERHLRLVFHRYLDSENKKNQLNLYFNGRKLEAIDPFMRSNKATQPLEPETLFVRQMAIKVHPYIMPFSSKLTAAERREMNEYKDLNLKQGLYIYRNKRLIVWGKWFRLLGNNDLQRLTRVEVELPNNLDGDWGIDVKKSSAQIPSEIKERLAQIVVRSVGKSERVYQYRGSRENVDKYDHIWNRVEDRGQIHYFVNRDMPMIQALMVTLNDDQAKMATNLLQLLEEGFPYSGVYYDLAKDKEPVEKTMTDEEVYEAIKDTIERMSNSQTAALQQLESMSKIDVLRKYPKALNMLREDYALDK